MHVKLWEKIFTKLFERLKNKGTRKNSRKFFGLKIIGKKHFYLLLCFLQESLFKFIASFCIVKKTTNSRLTSSLLTFFKFSLFIRVPLLKIHIPSNFGVHPSILHEKILFEFGVRILCFEAYVTKKNIRIILKKFFW